MKRIHRRIKIKKRNFIIMIIILLMISIILVFKIINKRVKPVLMGYALEETKRIASLVINSAVNRQISDNFSVDNLFDFKYDKTGNITNIDLNSIIVNKFLTTMTSNVELNLKHIEQGNIELIELEDIEIEYDSKKIKNGIIYEIPLGYALNNSIFTNILPKIPVKFNLVGSITSNISTKITNYGINNAMIEVYVDLKVNIRVILPLMSDTVTIKNSIPIAIKIIQGNIPKYYSGSNSNLSIPVE